MPPSTVCTARPRSRCRYCKRLCRRRSRRLCWRCYSNPDIRVLYPAPINQYGGDRQQLVPDRDDDRPLPEATDAPVGSPEKVAVLEARFDAGLALWHPDDVSEGVNPVAYDPATTARTWRPGVQLDGHGLKVHQ